MSTVIVRVRRSCRPCRSAPCRRPARPPTVKFSVRFTTHVTFGTFFGTRPRTSRSKSSTISGRRCFHHAAALVTLRPFFSVRTSGRFGIRVRERLVVVGVIGRGLVAARPGPQGRDAELLLHVLVIGGGCCGVRVWRRTAWRRTAWRRRCLRRRRSRRGCRRLLGSHYGCRQHHRRACRGRHTTSPDRPDAPRYSHDHHPVGGGPLAADRWRRTAWRRTARRRTLGGGPLGGPLGADR